MDPLRFVHAADLHLDSPFRGIGHVSPELGDRLSSATFESFARIVDHTIECSAAFLVIAGDLYDSRDRSLRALVQFRKQMDRLAERGIGAFVVHGNHDPLNGWGSAFGMPDNVVVFDDRIRTHPAIHGGREVARITGVSYPRERVTENLAAGFRPTLGSPYSIGLLHANIGGHTEHADYAPATVEDLHRAGFDYWALGHVHTRSVLAAEPSVVVYPGNPQGRHSRETGPRGCYQVDVDTHGRATLTFVETNTVRWEAIVVSIQPFIRLDQLLDELLMRGRQVAAAFPGKTVVGWTLRGSGPLHKDLQREGMAEEIRDQLQGTVDTESVRIQTGPELDLIAVRKSEALVADFLRISDRALEDPVLRARMTEALMPLFRRKEVGMPDEAHLREWIERARDLGVELLLDA